MSVIKTQLVNLIEPPFCFDNKIKKKPMPSQRMEVQDIAFLVFKQSSCTKGQIVQCP